MNHLEDLLVPIFVNLIIFGSVSFIIYTIFSTRHRERMAIIDKGLDITLLLNKSDGQTWRRFAISFGCLAIGVSVGVVIGVTLSNFFYDVFKAHDNSIQIILPMSFLFAGIGLIVSTYINNKQDSKLG